MKVLKTTETTPAETAASLMTATEDWAAAMATAMDGMRWLGCGAAMGRCGRVTVEGGGGWWSVTVRVRDAERVLVVAEWFETVTDRKPTMVVAGGRCFNIRNAYEAHLIQETSATLEKRPHRSAKVIDKPHFDGLRSVRKWLKRARGTRKSRRKLGGQIQCICIRTQVDVRTYCQDLGGTSKLELNLMRMHQNTLCVRTRRRI
ncbi:hypothetical protein PIB30_098476 [Stylosanthes scabra]|uniref:Uncharacterized protein n=1 Tax=Stylosanthes scabra TaxID=79078 RepID=A0ABU6YX79_9FABA|nr:hypothetical protein [Stylosanthes scabra]